MTDPIAELFKKADAEIEELRAEVARLEAELAEARQIIEDLQEEIETEWGEPTRETRRSRAWLEKYTKDEDHDQP